MALTYCALTSAGSVATPSSFSGGIAPKAHVHPGLKRALVSGQAIEPVVPPRAKPRLFVPALKSSQSRVRQLIPRSAAEAAPDVEPPPLQWHERPGPDNMISIHSLKELLDAFEAAGDKLVILDFYAKWCGSCKALYPKLCKILKAHPDVVLLKVDFDENKPVCKSLGVKMLPFFQVYRGADGKLDQFTASISKVQRIKDAIATHNTARCSLGPQVGVSQVDFQAAMDAAAASAEADKTTVAEA